MVKPKLSVKQPDVPPSEQPSVPPSEPPSEQPVVPPTGQPAGTTSSDPDALNVPNAPDAPQGISSDILTTISETVSKNKSEEEKIVMFEECFC